VLFTEYTPKATVQAAIGVIHLSIVFVSFLLSDESSYIHGAVISIDGGAAAL
jgi:NAD(P)-dependent dehydrogenase (short-subunit alcohol dehydrogenase family)